MSHFKEIIKKVVSCSHLPSLNSFPFGIHLMTSFLNAKIYRHFDLNFAFMENSNGLSLLHESNWTIIFLMWSMGWLPFVIGKFRTIPQWDISINLFAKFLSRFILMDITLNVDIFMNFQLIREISLMNQNQWRPHNLSEEPSRRIWVWFFNSNKNSSPMNIKRFNLWLKHHHKSFFNIVNSI